LAVDSSLQNLERGLLLLPDELLIPMEEDPIPSSSSSVVLYSTDRLQGLISQYRELVYLITKIPSSSHPFLQSQSPRLERVKQALSKDIRDAISTKRKQGDTNGVFTLLKLSRETDLQILNSN
jgi:hypothetical protein